ncbi:MAG: ABC transporter permease [Ferruginibacter sp.]|nr:ABC transporter permease [Cytophagales bacterium]
MLRNYFSIAWRNLVRHKVYSGINVLGLAIAMAACLLIVLYLLDETSYDRYHPNADRIYRVGGSYDQGGDTRNRSAITNFGLAPLLSSSFPFIEKTVRLTPVTDEPVRYGARKYVEEVIFYADEDFFNLFTFRFLRGNPARALGGPGHIVVTQTAATKYFGQDDPLGKTLDVDGNLVKVTGVIADVPPNSHFHFDMVISMKTVENEYPDFVKTMQSGAITHYTYLLLPKGYDAQRLAAQLPQFVKNAIGKEAPKHTEYFLQPLRDIHLRSALTRELEPNGDIRYVYVFVTVAIIILLIACVNYTNLATARAAVRAKEVGLRKVVGATRQQIIFQFLGESLLFAALAMVLALGLGYLATPLFNQLSGKTLTVNLLGNWQLLAGGLAFAAAVGLLAGSYPAFFLSAFQPVKTLKGSASAMGSGTLWLRKGLVVAQFTISIALVIATLLVYQQWTFMRNQKLGYNADQVITMPLQTLADTSGRVDAFKTQLLRNPRVAAVTASGNPLARRVGNWRQYVTAGKQDADQVNIATIDVDHDFFTTLQTPLVAGRGFSKQCPSDVAEAYVLNEAAVKFLGLDNPVGQPLRGSLFNGKDWKTKQGTIVGVVKDFHFASLHKAIEPVIFSLYSQETFPLSWLSVRISGQDLPGTTAFLKSTWATFVPDEPWQYTFLADDINNLYQAEAHFLRVFTVFSGLAIFIACLGTFGLAAFTAVQRTREIGIRKVLGAGVGNIVGMLSKDFLRLVLLANVIAWPLAWWAMQRWLWDFAYRIDIGWQPFALAGVAALLITLLTVSFQTVKAAVANPVKSLRNE